MTVTLSEGTSAYTLKFLSSDVAVGHLSSAYVLIMDRSPSYSARSAGTVHPATRLHLAFPCAIRPFNTRLDTAPILSNALRKARRGPEAEREPERYRESRARHSLHTAAPRQAGSRRARAAGAARPGRRLCHFTRAGSRRIACVRERKRAIYIAMRTTHIQPCERAAHAPLLTHVLTLALPFRPDTTKSSPLTCQVEWTRACVRPPLPQDAKKPARLSPASLSGLPSSGCTVDGSPRTLVVCRAPRWGTFARASPQSQVLRRRRLTRSLTSPRRRRGENARERRGG